MSGNGKHPHRLEWRVGLIGTSVILVTGGTGLVGRAIQHVVEHEPVDSQFGQLSGEKWVFLGSRDGDMRDPAAVKAIYEKYHPTHVIHRESLPFSWSPRIEQGSGCPGRRLIPQHGAQCDLPPREPAHQR